MIRAFNEHTIRSLISLDGRWEFSVESGHTDSNEIVPNFGRNISVPSCWESLPGLENYRGTAWLRRRFTTHKKKSARLVFGGVSHSADVYVDGNHVGHHYDAFVPFEIIITNLEIGEHELMVKVDNSFGSHSALHKENDYYTYGGITRPVELQELSDCHIEYMRLTPVQIASAWELNICLRIRNIGSTEQSFTASIGLDAVKALEELPEISLEAGEIREFTATLRNLDVETWSDHTPKLYMVTATLTSEGAAIDDYVDRVGFREVKVRGDQLLLNGEAVFLKGYNRHEDHPQFGCALPLEAIAIDLEIIRDLNCNFVRTSHYPNDMRFLDLCDEMGIYVWEESHARAVDHDHPKFREQLVCNTREMIRWHYNRPSIILWGCLNECDSHTEQGRMDHAMILQILRDEDGTRPVTFASNKKKQDICLDLVDIVSWNIYPGWYDDWIDMVGPTFEDLFSWLHHQNNPASGKPVIVSEFGAGGIYGNRQRCRSKWSEEYQSDLLAECLDVFLHHQGVVGLGIWQFSDIRVTSNWWMKRPRSLNNKGTVDEYRRPKLCYDLIKEKMSERKSV